MSDFFKEVFQNFQDRLRSYFFSNVILFLIIFNWRPLVFMLFSDASIVDRIIVYDNIYRNNIQYFWPIVYAIIYTAFSKYILIAFDWAIAGASVLRMRSIQWRRVKNIKGKVEEEKAKIELEKDKIKFRELENTDKEISKLNSEIDRLKSTISDSNEGITELNNSNLILQKENSNLKNILSNYSSLLKNFEKIEIIEFFDEELVSITKNEFNEFMDFTKHNKKLHSFLFSEPMLSEILRYPNSQSDVPIGSNHLSEIFKFMVENNFYNTIQKGENVSNVIYRLTNKGHLLKKYLEVL